MTIKHLVALAATVGALGFMNFARAADGRGSSGDGHRGNSSAAQKNPAADGEVIPERLRDEFAQVEADFRQIQKDCDSGNYEKAQADLDRLVKHRRQYERDKSPLPVSTGDGRPGAAAQFSPPSNCPGK